jgi:hypothetical protein
MSPLDVELGRQDVPQYAWERVIEDVPAYLVSLPRGLRGQCGGVLGRKCSPKREKFECRLHRFTGADGGALGLFGHPCWA